MSTATVEQDEKLRSLYVPSVAYREMKKLAVDADVRPHKFNTRIVIAGLRAEGFKQEAKKIEAETKETLV